MKQTTEFAALSSLVRSYDRRRVRVRIEMVCLMVLGALAFGVALGRIWGAL